MPTAKEYRLEAEACLKLAKRADEFYVKDALIELARDYERAAHQAERRERDMLGPDAQGILQRPAQKKGSPRS